MSIKTENLAIVMTDMAGFTEATVQQSRVEIEQLLETHNRILFPIVRRFKGRHIKSIGDALLLVFRSPTDAMLCAMAMQDALYEYNRSAPKEKQIRMRVGASLGEVRVARRDIFGEPVNMTSRVCNVTPADDIYLSEALYMAMNKAEVPSQEVGWKELKGIVQPVRLYHIPRFAVPRLVPDVIAAEDMTDLVYPYGGAHLTAHGRESHVLSGVRRFGRDIREAFGGQLARIALVVLLAAAAMLFAVHFVPQKQTIAGVVKPGAVAADRVHEPPPPPAPRAVAPASDKVAAAPAQVRKPAAPREYAHISDAKQAYRDKKLDKPEYRRIVDALGRAMKHEVDQVKAEYKAGRLTKVEYKARVKDIEQRYE